MKKIWAVEPTFLVEYLETTLNSPDEIKQKPAAFFGNISTEEKDIFSIDGDTAIINIQGLLSQEGPNLIDRIFGFTGTGYLEILEAIAEVQKSEDVKTVRLIMNTPGGQVDGVDKVFQAVSELSKSKTVIAESHGLIASAGYWIASAASRIIATSPADQIGSIGVVVVAVDFSKCDKEHGIEVIVIRSANAPNKVPDPATEKGKEVLQKRVDAIERVFIGRISEGRGIPVETIEKDFARGSVLIADDPDIEKDDALSVGMIDAVESPVIPAEAPKDGGRKQKAQDVPPITAPKKKEEKAMDLKEYMAKDSLLIKEIEVRDRENIVKGVAQEKTETAERIKTCQKYLTSDEYPQTIKNLALKVVSGESHPAALEGAVAIIDSQNEEKKAKAAAEETGEQTETPPDTHDGGTAPEGICDTNEAFEALMKKENEAHC
jgi:ClpP class serine protease